MKIGGRRKGRKLGQEGCEIGIQLCNVLLMLPPKCRKRALLRGRKRQRCVRSSAHVLKLQTSAYILKRQTSGYVSIFTSNIIEIYLYIL